MFGISVYLKDMTREYVEMASKYGAKYIFTSLHIPEEDLSDARNQLKQLLDYSKEFGLMLAPDVSPLTFEKLGITNESFDDLHELGIEVIRLDFGFDEPKIVKKLQEHFTIMLNASTIDESFILECKKENVDFNKVIAVHNFYPKKDTALSKEYYLSLNKNLRKYGFEILTFVTGDNLKRFPLYEGLPTIEEHRDIDPYVATVELMEVLGTDGVMIGDSMAKEKTISYIHDYMENNILNIPVILNEDYHYLYDKELEIRVDLSDSVIRIAVPRQVGIQPKDNGPRKYGNILLINSLGGRYCGEMQICKKDLSFEADANVMGCVSPKYIDLLKYISSSHKIKFVKG